MRAAIRSAQRLPAGAVLALLAALLGGGAAEARQDAAAAPAAPRASSRPSPDVALEALWFARKAALESDDTAAAAGRVEEMVRLARAERLDRVTWLARGFAFEGYVHLREGNYERAREAFDIARRFDPRLAEAQTGYAWASLRAGRGAGAFVEEYRRALWLRWETFRREGAANLFLLGAIASWVIAAGIVGGLLLRYQALLRHDVAERMPRGWPEGASRLAGWIVLLLPLLFWISGPWILLWWIALLGRYFSPSERLVAALVCLGMLAAGPLAARGADAAEVASDPRVLAVEEALQGGYGASVLRELQAIVDSAPGSGPLRLLLAGTFERAGLSREAFEEYQRILQDRPAEPRALNNIGNLYLATGQTGQAVLFYTRAAEADPDDAVIFHNLALAQAEALRLADAEASIQRLQVLDPELARTLVATRARGEEPTPVPATVGREEVWREIPAKRGDAPGSDLAALFSPVGLGAILALLMVGMTGLRRPESLAQACVRCGDPFCGRCKRDLGAKECCAQCINVFIKKEAVASNVRARKIEQVERHHRIWKVRVRGASVLLPGAGHLLAGQALGGAALAVAWLVPLTLLVFGRFLIMPPTLPVLDLPGLATILLALLMAGTWGVANLLLPRPPL